jgi:hypothetical protein
VTSPIDDAARQPSAKRAPGMSRTPLWIAGAAVLGFLVGFLWQYTGASRARGDAEAATQALHAARLEATLSGAVIDAQGGRYEVARQRASDFYSGLQRELLPLLQGEAADEARRTLDGRDSVITALARNDPAMTGVLVEELARFRRTVSSTGLDSVYAPGTR